MSAPELLVVDDLVDAAVELFLEVSPRTVALSGGSTPKPVYERLAGIEYPWHEVDVFFGDERCVPADHPDSNFRMADEALLSRIDAPVHSMVGCDADAYATVLEASLGDAAPRLDLLFLGIGDDGHTASLFPDGPALDVTDRWVVFVEKPGMPPPHSRLTLTFPVLNAAHLALFLVSGESKREPLRKLVERDTSIPAARVDAERVVVLADRSAAGS